MLLIVYIIFSCPSHSLNLWHVWLWVLLYSMPLVFFIFVTEKHLLAISCQPHFTNHPAPNLHTLPTSTHRKRSLAQTMQSIGDLLSTWCDHWIQSGLTFSWHCKLTQWLELPHVDPFSPLTPAFLLNCFLFLPQESSWLSILDGMWTCPMVPKNIKLLKKWINWLRFREG